MSDPSPFTPPVLAALILSGASFLAAFGALAWQVIAFRLAGGRVRVEMMLAELIPYSGTAMIRTRDDGKRSWANQESARPGPGIELVNVVVENPGRLAVTITKVELVLTGATAEQYSATPQIFSVPRVDASSSDRTHLRLEPYSQATFLFDFWNVIDHERVQGADGPIGMRARVRVAGRKYSHSPKAKRWSFKPSDVTSRERPDRIAVSDVIMREVMRHGWVNNSDIKPGDLRLSYPMSESFVRKAAAQIGATTDVDGILDTLEKVAVAQLGQDRAMPMAFVGFEVHEYLTRHRNAIEWNA